MFLFRSKKKQEIVRQSMEMTHLTTYNPLIIRQILSEKVYYIPSSATLPELLGSKNGNLLIIVKIQSADHEYIPPATKKTLLAMLRLGEYTLDHAAILNLAVCPGISWQALRQHVPAKKILFMGVLPEQLGLQVQCPPYNTLPLNDLQFMCTESPEQLSKGSDNKKREHWAAIKRIF